MNKEELERYRRLKVAFTFAFLFAALFMIGFILAISDLRECDGDGDGDGLFRIDVICNHTFYETEWSYQNKTYIINSERLYFEILNELESELYCEVLP